MTLVEGAERPIRWPHVGDEVAPSLRPRESPLNGLRGAPTVTSITLRKRSLLPLEASDLVTLASHLLLQDFDLSKPCLVLLGHASHLGSKHPHLLLSRS